MAAEYPGIKSQEANSQNYYAPNGFPSQMPPPAPSAPSGQMPGTSYMVMPPPAYVGPNQVPLQMPPQNTDPQWRNGLCDCFRDWSWCMIGCFFPAALIYGIMERSRNGPQGKKVFMWMMYGAAMWVVMCLLSSIAGGLWILGLVVVLIAYVLLIIIRIVYCFQVAQLRTDTRKRYGIEGSENKDLLVSVCCCWTPLHLCQMFYEVHSREGVLMA